MSEKMAKAPPEPPDTRSSLERLADLARKVVSVSRAEMERREKVWSRSRRRKRAIT